VSDHERGFSIGNSVMNSNWLGTGNKNYQ